ncbi:hypothetical protein pb186bvf_015901 [Paramecium bursaria]
MNCLLNQIFSSSSSHKQFTFNNNKLNKQAPYIIIKYGDKIFNNIYISNIIIKSFLNKIFLIYYQVEVCFQIFILNLEQRIKELYLFLQLTIRNKMLSGEPVVKPINFINFYFLCIEQILNFTQNFYQLRFHLYNEISI